MATKKKPIKYTSREFDTIKSELVKYARRYYPDTYQDFTDASFAYQGGGRSLDLSRIEVLENWVQGEFRPDLTLLLDLSVDIGMTRIEARSAKDRIEQEGRAFFERVRQVFIDRSQQYPDRIKLVDASVAIY
jgi:dTMP kinase